MATAVETRVEARTAPRRMTLQEFLDHPWGDTQVELVGGEVRLRGSGEPYDWENPPVMTFASGAHAWIARTLFRALDAHVTARALGDVFPDGTGYALPGLADVFRGPDVSFVRAGRLDGLVHTRAVFPIAPDLAIEVLSPNERYSEVSEKLRNYFASGTTLAWVVDPRRRQVEIHVAGQAMHVVGEGETLDGAPVLPDFRLPVAEVFADIAPER